MNAASHGGRAPLLWLLLPVIAGLAAGRLVTLPARLLLPPAGLFLIGAFFAAWSDRSRIRKLWAPAFVAAMALAGMAYLGLRRNRPAGWEAFPPREARLDLRVTRVFASSAPGKRLNGLAVVTGADRHLRELTGQRLFISCRLARGMAPPPRTSRIRAIGVLELVPRHPAPGGFAAYLSGAGLNFQLTRGRLLEVRAGPGRHQRFRQAAADRLHEILGTGLERRPALAGIFRAMMLGRTEELSGGQRELFLHCGALHLFAISGLHIGAIALSLQSLMLLLRVPRPPAAALGLAALWLYVDITGASPSAVRAFFMAALVIGAFALRRPGDALSALVASALLVLAIDPHQLFGASFQMSYGIVAALLLLGVPLGAALQVRFALFTSLPESSWRRAHRWLAGAWRWFLGLLGVGLAATLVSAVAGVQFFQLLTPGSLPGNLVLIPLATLVIAAGLGSLLCGLAGLAAGTVLFNHAAALLLWLMSGFLGRASVLGGSALSAHFRAAWLGPAGLALLLATCLVGRAGRWHRRRGGFWPPFAVVALLLTVAVAYG